MSAALTMIARFAGYLREHGLAVGIAEQQAMVQSALLTSTERLSLEAGWRAIVCRNPAQWRRFPGLFRDFWFPERGGRTRISGELCRARDLKTAVEQMHAAMAAGAAPAAGDAALNASDPVVGEAGEGSAQGGASQVDALERAAVRGWLPQDLTRLQRIVEALAARLRRRLLRRERHAVHGRRLDLRRTLRTSLRTGGIPFHPRWMQRRRERPRLLFMVDVSRSMETFAQLFLRVARAFVQATDARAFVFHTRLAEVTSLLRSDSGRVQEKINAVTAGFGGGTRIAASIDALCASDVRHALSRATRVVFMSDGFDSDPPQRLAQSLTALRRRGVHLYWLHPLRDRPQSAALQASAALIDAFAPVHDLDSLAQLDRVLR